MSIWNKETFTVNHNGTTYAVTKLGIDISEDWGYDSGTVEISHRIEGFPTAIYIIADLNTKTFGFGHKVIEDGSDTGLFVTLQDGEMFERVCELLDYINEIYE